MSDFIKKSEVLNTLSRLSEKSTNDDMRFALSWARDIIETIPAEKVREVVTCHNANTVYDPVDRFQCSECGIELEGWCSIETDEDTDDETYYEYMFRYCSNCGAKIE